MYQTNWLKPLMVLFNVIIIIIDIILFNNRVIQFFSCKAIINKHLIST